MGVKRGVLKNIWYWERIWIRHICGLCYVRFDLLIQEVEVELISWYQWPVGEWSKGDTCVVSKWGYTGLIVIVGVQSTKSCCYHFRYSNLHPTNTNQIIKFCHYKIEHKQWRTYVYFYKTSNMSYKVVRYNEIWKLQWRNCNMLIIWI